MKKIEESTLALIKYEGDLVKEGYLDAKKAGEALVGMDELLRYFIYQESPESKGYTFELPVRVKKGSWETLFPENLELFAVEAFSLWMAGKYFGSALEEVAKNDFKNVSFKEIFKESFRNIIKVIRLAKHLKSLSKKKIENYTFSDNNESIKIKNDDGDEMQITLKTLELYLQCPQSIFNKLVKIVEEERELSFQLHDDIIVFEEKITISSKHIFSKSEEDDEVILPELVHGEYVELQGHITRGNEKTNTLGFLYEGHIITCIPENGNIKNHKSKMFNNCLIKGYVDRLDKSGNTIEKRPRIRFIEIINLDVSNLDLFSQ